MVRKFLTLIRDQDWKDIRSSITPAFTTGKIKRVIYSKVVYFFIHSNIIIRISVDVTHDQSLCWSTCNQIWKHRQNGRKIWRQTVKITWLKQNVENTDFIFAWHLTVILALLLWTWLLVVRSVWQLRIWVKKMTHLWPMPRLSSVLQLTRHRSFYFCVRHWLLINDR